MFRRKKRGGVILHDGPPLLPEPAAVSRQSFSLENLQKVYGHNSEDEKSGDKNIYSTYLNIEPSPTDASNPASLDEAMHHPRGHIGTNGDTSRESTVENSANTSFASASRPESGTITRATTAGSSGRTWEGIPEEDTIDEEANTDESVPRIMTARKTSISKSPGGASQHAHTVSGSSALPWSFPTPPTRSNRASTMGMIPPMRRHSNFRLSASPWARAATEVESESATAKAHHQQMTIAKHITLKRGKAPTSFRVMVMGAPGTGKTMWIKSFVESLMPGGGLPSNTWTEEMQQEVHTFGVTRRAGVTKPTKKLTSLGGLEITPSKTLLVNAVSDDDKNNAATTNVNNNSLPQQRRRTSSRASMSSAYLSLGSAAPPQKLSLSLIDTPALPRDTSASASSSTLPIVDEVTSRYMKTLQEEGKLNRLPTVDRQHVHLVLWFIDPREVLDGEWWYRAKESERRDKEWKQRTQRGAGAKRESITSTAETVRGGGKQATGMVRARSTSQSAASSGSGSSSFVTIKSGGEAGPSKGSTLRRIASGGFRAAKSSSEAKRESVSNSFFSSDTEPSGDVSNEAKEMLTNDGDEDGDTDEEEDEEVYVPTLSPTQKLALRQIIPIVPVMPIVARSDTLTTRELQSVRDGIKRGWRDVIVQLRREKGTENGSNSSQQDDYSLDGDLASGEDEDDDTPRWEWDWLNDDKLSSDDVVPDHTDPRHLLGINHIVPSPKDLFTSRHWPPAIFSPEMESLPSVAAKADEQSRFTRVFGQNTLHLLNARHCDFMLLRCVLLGTHTGRILDSSKARYEIWRRRVVSRVRERER